MLHNDLQYLISQFAFDGSLAKVEEMTAGNINTTYKLTFTRSDGSDIQYVLQKINTFVFKDPVGLMNNSEMVVEHIAGKLDKMGSHDDRRTLYFIPTVKGDYLYHHEADNSFWRADIFVVGATAYNSIEDPRHFYEAGRGFGEFQKQLSDFPAEKLAVTIPDFHNTPKRFCTFVEAVYRDDAGRVSSVEEEIDFVFAHRKLTGKVAELIKSGELPLRVTHNDTKLNNVLLDNETGKALCVIDLDTVMPGTVLFDYGDAIRYGACTAAEDEPDVNKVGLDMELFRQFTDGFVSEIADTLTETEIRALPLGALVITCEQVIRFLTDYINGDTYFKTTYPNHNLDRTHTQMKLLTEMEAHFDEMQAYVDELLAKRGK